MTEKGVRLEQYKLFVGTAERVSDRRESSNKYFLSINSLLLGISGYLTISSTQSMNFLVPVLGAILSIYWLLTLKSYRGLNTAKFKVIHNIEKKLPEKLFDNEWDLMDRGNNPNKYLKLSVLEQAVPILFFVLYLTIFILNF